MLVIDELAAASEGWHVAWERVEFPPSNEEFDDLVTQARRMVQRVSDAEKQAPIVVAELELLAPTHVLAAVHAAHEAALRVEEVQKVGSLMELDDMVLIMRADLSMLPGPSQKSSGKVKVLTNEIMAENS